MVEPLVEPHDKLSADDIRGLPQMQRGKFIESSVLSLINANGSRGLSISEIERVTQYPKNTLLKHMELLFSKRKIHKITRGRFSLYYPNGIIQNTHFRDIMYGRNSIHRYGVNIVHNINGKYLHIQEREIDENGFPEDIGGVLIPLEKISELVNLMLVASKEAQEVVVNEVR